MGLALLTLLLSAALTVLVAVHDDDSVVLEQLFSVIRTVRSLQTQASCNYPNPKRDAC